MSPDRLRKARDLMTAALAMSPPDREEFLRQETEGDEELLEETLVLMEGADGDATEVMAESTHRRPQLFEEAYLAGKKQIGNYRLIRRIGQGGMGMVYAACLVTEDFQRQVALKLVKPSLASSQILRRFRMERQLLAGLDHPNIARLLDAGTTDEGAPYLVMEYVEGLPIDRYCESKNLSIVDRLKLFLTVCDAIQYAHQNLIIHRDIKPSNILVSSDGMPKLLDFGIAKLIRPEDSEAGPAPDLRLTATDSRPMSPHYASPEQARGEPITTASDVYSLGVLLYELLTGRLPYEFKSRSPAQIERTICETVPAPPSEVDFKGALPETPDKMRRRLRGDLDMILLVAMRKEVARRYSSVHQLSEDIRRHLNGLPVTAQKDTFGYRFSKFVGRHATAVAAATLAVLALIAATGVSLHFAQVATKEKRVAEQRFQDTRELALFFITDFDKKIRTSQTEARRALVAKGLEYLKRLSEEVQNNPKLLREVIIGYLKMGDVQGNPFGPNLGDREGARQSYREALQLAEKHGGADVAAEIIQARVGLADMDALGDARAALRVYEEVLPSVKGVEEANVRNRAAFVRWQLGDQKRALAEYDRVLEVLRRELPRDASVDVRSMYAQALQYSGMLLANRQDSGSVNAAITKLQEALKTYDELGLRSSQLKCSVLLAETLAKAGRFQEAEARHRENIDTAYGLVREDPTNRQTRLDYIASLNRLTDFLAARKMAPAEQKALTIRTLQELRPLVERSDPGVWELQMAVWILVNTPFDDLRRPPEALAYAQKWLEKTGTTDPQALNGAATAYYAMGDSQKAVALAKKALAQIPADSANTDLMKELQSNLVRFQSAATKYSQSSKADRP